MNRRSPLASSPTQRGLFSSRCRTRVARRSGRHNRPLRVQHLSNAYFRKSVEEPDGELLLRRWSRAKTSEGQVVLLSGEAGIGKSRLTAGSPERLTGEPHTRLRHSCSPQHTDSAVYPVISQMERAAGFVHDDTAKAKLKVDAVLAQTSTRIEDAPAKSCCSPAPRSKSRTRLFPSGGSVDRAVRDRAAAR